MFNISAHVIFQRCVPVCYCQVTRLEFLAYAHEDASGLFEFGDEGDIFQSNDIGKTFADREQDGVEAFFLCRQRNANAHCWLAVAACALPEEHRCRSFPVFLSREANVRV